MVTKKVNILQCSDPVIIIYYLLIFSFYSKYYIYYLKCVTDISPDDKGNDICSNYTEKFKSLYIKYKLQTIIWYYCQISDSSLKLP